MSCFCAPNITHTHFTNPISKIFPPCFESKFFGWSDYVQTTFKDKSIYLSWDLTKSMKLAFFPHLATHTLCMLTWTHGHICVLWSTDTATLLSLLLILFYIWLIRALWFLLSSHWNTPISIMIVLYFLISQQNESPFHLLAFLSTCLMWYMIHHIVLAGSSLNLWKMLVKYSLGLRLTSGYLSQCPPLTLQGGGSSISHHWSDYCSEAGQTTSFRKLPYSSSSTGVTEMSQHTLVLCRC